MLDHSATAAAERSPAPHYAELHCLSNFSFQRGASSADELFTRARALGYAALAITDECSLAGAVCALRAAEETGRRQIVGSEFVLADGPKLVLLCEDATGYAALSRLITTGRRAAAKGDYRLTRADLEALPTDGLLALWIPRAPDTWDEELAWTAAHFPRCRPVGAASAATASTFCVPRSTLCEQQDLANLRTTQNAQRTTLEAEAVAAEAAPTAAAGCDPGEPRLWIAVELHREAGDDDRLAALQALSRRSGVPLVASGDAHMHLRRRRALQDALTAIRLGRPVADCGYALFANGERHLRRCEELAELYPHALLHESVRIAGRCRFSLREVNYRYPKELVPDGRTPTGHLRALTEAGAATRWPAGVPADARALIEKELALIARLGYEAFFLTVEDIVRWARERGILCQGRGSAANSVVCYCLGITAVGPDRIVMLFERFVSEERDEPPDIDVDFEHERREEVIQYVYGKYGRERAALAATVIRYRHRSAARDLGRALGFGEDRLDQLSRAFSWSHGDMPVETRLREAGFDPRSPEMHRFVRLLDELIDFPRHLSQHVGGFVISDQPLWELVPVENATMPDRTVIQWDKDDLETLGLLKVDCLALGMLSCLRRCFDLVRRHHGETLTLAGVREGDAATYDMIRRADTIGVFQIESRAQMSMLPRLKPEHYYDLVIQVAIVRPGPIQGGMVHPYLRRRSGEEEVTYPSEAVRGVLGRTFGVPIFQEQVMALLQVAADFTPGEADRLRRAMAAWKRKGGLEPFRDRIFEGLARNGYPQDYAERIFEQIKGFGSYGFPESHAASFALLAYVSSYLKCRYPAAFTCALLNAQPMGFYAPAQLVADARRHGVRVLPPDVVASDWDCTLVEAGNRGESGRSQVEAACDFGGLRPLERPSAVREGRGGMGNRKAESRQPALRLGLRLVNGLSEDTVSAIVAARALRPFRDVANLVARAGLDERARNALAQAGALRRLAGHRHRAQWAIAGSSARRDLLLDARTPETRIALRPPTAAEDTFADYAGIGLTLQRHPAALVRRQLAARRVRCADQLPDLADGTPVRCAGLVTIRQRPGTASGITFVTIEDETGSVNVVVRRELAVRQRRELLDSVLLAVDGILENRSGVRHLLARRLVDYSPLLAGLRAEARNFH